MAKSRVTTPPARCCIGDGSDEAVRVCALQSRCQVRSEPAWSLAWIHGHNQCRPRQRLKNGVVRSRNAEHVVMSICIVDCSDTSDPTAMGSARIPVVSRETEGRSPSPPRGVGVVLCGASQLHRGPTYWRQKIAASQWDSQPRGQAASVCRPRTTEESTQGNSYRILVIAGFT